MSLAHTIIADVSSQNDFGSSNEHLLEEHDLELHGVYFMEHMNFVVGDRKKAEEFYCNCIGFKRDPKINTNLSFHINLGQQQLHVAEETAVAEAGDDAKTNKIFGNI